MTWKFTGKPVRTMFGLALMVASAAGIAGAQTLADAQPEAKPVEAKPAEAKPASTYETLYLINSAQQNDLNDVQTAIRNVLPRARVYAMPSQHSITLWAPPEDIALAKKILADLDKPHKVYRLTFTLTEIEGGKRGAAQHYALIAASGEKTELKEGSRVPLVTGSVSDGSTTVSTQVQYVDLGLNIEATVDSSQDGARLRTKIERSSVAEEKPLLGAQDPVIRQTQLDQISLLTLGKPLVLGSLDMPGTTRQLEVEVVAELVK